MYLARKIFTELLYQKLRKLLVVLLFFSSFSNGWAQSEKWIEIGDEAMQQGYYRSALQNYKKGLRSQKGNDKLLYKCAEAARIYSNYKEASEFYNQIIRLGKEKLFPELYFYLGTMYRYLDSASGALEAFEKYNKEPLEEKKHLEAAKQAMESCRWAIENPTVSDEITIEHLSNKINTKNSEWGAVMVKDDLLLFSSMREQKMDGERGRVFSNRPILSNIYQSKVKGENYTLASINEWGLNSNNSHTSNVCLDKLNNRIYFTRCKMSDADLEPQRCEIFYQELNKKNSKPQKLCSEINTSSYTATQPAIAYIDGKTVLFFVSDRPGGFGGMDIWYSILSEKEKCSTPMNLGNIINTPGDEITPFYDTQNHLLYFSSDYHHGYGGFDIFSSKDSLFYWGTPQNLGKPINSSANDTYFTINTFSKTVTGFLTSNREDSFFIDNATCCNDIYSWTLLEKKTKTLDTTVQKSVDSLMHTTFKTLVPVEGYKMTIDSMLPIKLYFDNDEPNPGTQKLTTQYTYNQLVEHYLKRENTYQKEYSKGINSPQKEEAIKQINDFFTENVKNSNAQFVEFIHLLLLDLSNEKQIRLQVRGYASPLYVSAYNENLSKRRISSIINQLLKVKNENTALYTNKEGFSKGSLEIVELALGSSTASEKVSNNPNDLRNSIYSVVAAKERRVEILRYDYIASNGQEISNLTTNEDNKLLESALNFERKFFALGEIFPNKGLQLEIPIYNSSDEPQIIEMLESGCTCTKVSMERLIEPKENGFILVEIDATKEKPGTFVMVPITIKVASEGFSQTIFLEYQITYQINK